MNKTSKIILVSIGCITIVTVASIDISVKPKNVDTTEARARPVEREKEIEPPAQRLEPVGISSVASKPYTSSENPRTILKFGNAVTELNAARLKAAEIAARHNDCDYVENSQITTRSTINIRRYWVECRNLTRYYFDEASLARGEAVHVQTKADWLEHGLKDW